MDDKQPAAKSPSEQDRRTCILEAAKILFISDGYSGTSISKIADKAGVTRSLIFHHYKNKQCLWAAVKEEMLKLYFSDIDTQIPPPESGLKAFLNTLFTSRFKFYRQHPEMARLISWQRLEGSELNQLGTHAIFKRYCQAIRALQEQDMIRNDLDPAWVLIAASSISAPAIYDHYHHIGDQQGQEQYVALCIDIMSKGLAPE